MLIDCLTYDLQVHVHTAWYAIMMLYLSSCSYAHVVDKTAKLLCYGDGRSMRSLLWVLWCWRSLRGCGCLDYIPVDRSARYRHEEVLEWKEEVSLGVEGRI